MSNVVVDDRSDWMDGHCNRATESTLRGPPDPWHASCTRETFMRQTYNECGCGCEQDESCPEYVDCQPGSGGDPLCTDTETRPYTVRAE